MIDDYTLLTPAIGRGSFGEVYKAVKKNTPNMFYAVKKISKDMERDPRKKKYLDNELKILSKVDHPNIVKLYDIKQNTNFYFLVTELCNGGSLTDCMEIYRKNVKEAPFSQKIVQYLMKQIVSALQYLAHSSILHRDLKLDNILVNFDSNEDKDNLNMLKCKVKLIDFGFARYYSEENLGQTTLGSPLNMDPKLLEKMYRISGRNSYKYDQKADIWSLGTLCYEMLIGFSPFDSSTKDELIHKINEGNYKIPSNVELSKEAISFLNCMLRYDPKERLDINQIAKHKFLNEDVGSFTKINLKKIQGNNGEIVMNIKESNQSSIWDLFENDIDHDQIKGEDMILPEGGDEDKLRFTKKIVIGDNEEIITDLDNQRNEIKISPYNDNNKNNIIEQTGKQNAINEINDGKKFIIDDNLRNLLLKSFIEINEKTSFIEPMLIPILPGEFPVVATEVSEFAENII